MPRRGQAILGVGHPSIASVAKATSVEQTAPRREQQTTNNAALSEQKNTKQINVRASVGII
jgi:hypothetical protein